MQSKHFLLLSLNCRYNITQFHHNVTNISVNKLLFLYYNLYLTAFLPQPSEDSLYREPVQRRSASIQHGGRHNR